ncbi:5'-methylthioadenosine/S-adenosylhomocysteine nucleosidase family protein [Arsenicibacter rosenii]|uniref:Nucleosidase n=1 Tax=Arsenicibacter rosenii TaxID=1750698 RepID=A0A1S2VKP2_9BACT|nr:nucleosidase [Arsenicibacter rosenii]OIN59319.1 nucleosidase [Arsenicibacter rosenii]
MIPIDTITSFPLEETLFVFALESEAGTSFDNRHTLFTGIGKVNAAVKLTRAIYRSRPKLIVNLGSAGSNVYKKGEVVCCTAFVQRDMDVRGLGYALYETPLSGIPMVLSYGLTLDGLPKGVCGSGDSFDMSHAETIYNVVDMEAYPLALIAMQEQIPFLCLKYITDGANDAAAEDWNMLVHRASEAFSGLLFAKALTVEETK